MRQPNPLQERHRAFLSAPPAPPSPLPPFPFPVPFPPPPRQALASLPLHPSFSLPTSLSLLPPPNPATRKSLSASGKGAGNALAHFTHTRNRHTDHEGCTGGVPTHTIRGSPWPVPGSPLRRHLWRSPGSASGPHTLLQRAQATHPTRSQSARSNYRPRKDPHSSASTNCGIAEGSKSYASEDSDR